MNYKTKVYDTQSFLGMSLLSVVVTFASLTVAVFLKSELFGTTKSYVSYLAETLLMVVFWNLLISLKLKPFKRRHSLAAVIFFMLLFGNVVLDILSVEQLISGQVKGLDEIYLEISSRNTSVLNLLVDLNWYWHKVLQVVVVVLFTAYAVLATKLHSFNPANDILFINEQQVRGGEYQLLPWKSNYLLIVKRNFHIEGTHPHLFANDADKRNDIYVSGLTAFIVSAEGIHTESTVKRHKDQLMVFIRENLEKVFLNLSPDEGLKVSVPNMTYTGEGGITIEIDSTNARIVYTGKNQKQLE